MKKLSEADLANVSESQIEAEICKRDFYQFVLKFWPVVESSELRDGWYIRAICKHLQHATDFERLGVNLPPGHGKSLLASILYPAWLLANDPTIRILCCTHSQALSLDFAVRCRRLIESDEYKAFYPNVK